ncbi:MAG: 6,7-dimethyl-8-ribityllumazine synthase [Porphyromonas sp.]|nr:6,7-dimethyl-8-ribityllumazine synthase [Porphyromonas sp.]
MSTSDLSYYDPEEVPSGEKKKVTIIVSEWNSNITFALRDAAIETLLKFGVRKNDIYVRYVPGSFELIYATTKSLHFGNCDAIIALGSIIKGETPHFDYISQSVMNNLGYLNANTKLLSGTLYIPIINGVLTTDNMQQAEDRAGGKLGNKGIEAAIVALKMMRF